MDSSVLKLSIVGHCRSAQKHILPIHCRKMTDCVTFLQVKARYQDGTELWATSGLSGLFVFVSVNGYIIHIFQTV